MLPLNVSIDLFFLQLVAPVIIIQSDTRLAECSFSSILLACSQGFALVIEVTVSGGSAAFLGI